MTAPERIPIGAIGAFSPLGATWVQTCASLHAGLARFGDHPWYEAATADPGWDEADPLRCSAVPGWQPTLDRARRLEDLALEAMRDLLDRVPLRRTDLARGGLLLLLPPDAEVPGASHARDGVVPRLLARAGLDGFARAEARAAGPAAFFPALREAAARVRSGELSFCIAGGVDSYLFDARLDRLDAAWRLRTRRNPDGFLAGEAAALLLVGSPARPAAAGLRPLCWLGPLGAGSEPASILGDRASTGAGLTDAIRAASDGVEPSWVVCDLNGESYRAFEWGLVQGRLSPLLSHVRRLTHPADGLGDVGAATGPLLVACAAHGFQRGFAPPGSALLWASSDDGARVAMLASTPGKEQGPPWPAT